LIARRPDAPPPARSPLGQRKSSKAMSPAWVSNCSRMPQFSTHREVSLDRRAGAAGCRSLTASKMDRDFREIRSEVFGKDEDRQLADMRRSRAVEADAGGTTDADLANKMANTINASARLRKTYTPVNVVSVRRVDEARQRGRRAIKDGSN